MSQLDQEFHEDGTPRRKYELEEREESRTGLKAAVGLAIATGIVLMRNMLFGEEGKAQAAEQNVAQSTAQAPGGTVGAAAELSAATFEEEAEDEEKAQADEGSSASMSNVLISSSLTPVRIYDGALASAVTKRNGSLPAANNDNERLYGAAQGHRIDLSRFESSFDGDWGRFGGGPGRDLAPLSPSAEGRVFEGRDACGNLCWRHSSRPASGSGSSAANYARATCCRRRNNSWPNSG